MTGRDEPPSGTQDKEFLRYMVDDPTGQPPGTIVVETKKRMLYYVLPNKKAMRYGVALGRDSFGWTGIYRGKTGLWVEALRTAFSQFVEELRPGARPGLRAGAVVPT